MPEGSDGNRDGMIRLAVLQGDGIGPEIMAATLAVLRALDSRLGLGLAFREVPVGLETLRTVGTTLPDSLLVAYQFGEM